MREHFIRLPVLRNRKRLKLEYEDDDPILVGRKGRTKPASARVDSLPRQIQTEHCDFSRKSKGRSTGGIVPAHIDYCV